jgi:hypothetical protein
MKSMYIIQQLLVLMEARSNILAPLIYLFHSFQFVGELNHPELGKNYFYLSI